MTTDYGTTIHLPKTDFQRRAGLAIKEPLLLARWEKMDLYQRQREVAKGREKFILHMGPPFANGHIHLGHVLSTVLKDVVCRSQQQLGFDAPLVPGFDCHGLPIEWKIEEDYRSKGKTGMKDSAPVEFRTKCREFAQGWVTVQSGEFQRIGILGDFKNPYLTMDKKSEAFIEKEIHTFLLNGSLYRGSKPVMWSIPEQTALAEAEIEYKDITSDTAYVKFPIKSLPANLPSELKDASVVIWTTTPWTLPANRAVAYGADLDYVLLTVSHVPEESLLKPNDKLLICENLVESFLQTTKIDCVKRLPAYKGSDLAGIICHHPLHGKGYEFDVPMLAGDFVTTDTGTGFVHIAPGHGEEDYKLGMKNNIEIPHTVAGDGKYFEHVPLFAGVEVYSSAGKKGPANKFVLQAIAEAGNLVAKAQIQHSYPHSWRSKAPVIFRNTPQWFFSMEKNDLRHKALAEIKKTKWIPARGENRLASMVEGRGDWCVSRQRAWGVPIALFVNKNTGEPLRDEKVLNRIFEIFLAEGSDAWLARPAQDFLGTDYKADDFEQVKDIIDVWIESGSTQGYVLEERPELQRPADVYLEGSDQHRGWFQSSLLVGCGTRGNAPYKAVVTHGFILDEKGYKMSKSEGNVTSPIKLTEKYGADILRLWVVGSDYTNDIRFGENILKGHVDIYSRIRGTFCYLLGNLNGFTDADKTSYAELSELDQWVLHKLHELDGVVKESIAQFDFLRLITALHTFCTKELSAFYFDVCKDTLYCEAKNSPKRRAILTVLDHVFNALVHWLAPILCFTTEEAWLSYKGLTMEDVNESIHLRTFAESPAEWHAPALENKFETVLVFRSHVTEALELKRAEKLIGSSLEAKVKIYVSNQSHDELLQSVDFADICIVSNTELVKKFIEGVEVKQTFQEKNIINIPTIQIFVEKASGAKCERCWKYTEDVGSDAAHPTICKRCAEVVKGQ